MRVFIGVSFVLLVTAFTVAGCGSAEKVSSVTGSVSSSVVALATTSTTRTSSSSVTSLATTSTAPPTTVSSLPSGWSTFESDAISLALPDSFEGGNPTDPKVIDTLRRITKNTGFDMEAILESADAGLLLFILAEPNADGFAANVTATRQSIPPAMSMKQCVEALTSNFPDAEIESLTEDRAYAVCTAQMIVGDEPTLHHFDLSIAGGYLYSVCYTFDVKSNTELDSIYRTSAETIVIKEE